MSSRLTTNAICGDEDGRNRVKKAAKSGRSFSYDDLGLALMLLDTIKSQAIEMHAADPTAVGFPGRAAQSA